MADAYVVGALLPERHFTWLDDDNQPVDFSAAELKVIITDERFVTVSEKTTGLTAGAPEEAPNFLIAWEEGDLPDSPGRYFMFLYATEPGELPRIRREPLHMIEGPTP